MEGVVRAPLRQHDPAWRPRPGRGRVVKRGAHADIHAPALRGGVIIGCAPGRSAGKCRVAFGLGANGARMVLRSRHGRTDAPGPWTHSAGYGTFRPKRPYRAPRAGKAEPSRGRALGYVVKREIFGDVRAGRAAVTLGFARANNGDRARPWRRRPCGTGLPARPCGFLPNLRSEPVGPRPRLGRKHTHLFTGRDNAARHPRCASVCSTRLRTNWRTLGCR